MLEAARIIAKLLKGDILLKGGHLQDTSDDLLFTGGEAVWFRGPHIENSNTHGTGCGLAEGLSVRDSVAKAKEFITGAIADGLDLGSGSGPLNHMYRLPFRFG